MAEESGERAKLPFGASPATLTIGGVVLVAVLGYLALPLLGGQQSAPTATAVAANALVPAVVTQAAPTPSSPANPGAAPAAEDPLATFLVRFGRTNPFAPLGGAAGAVSSGQTGTPPRQTGSSTLQDLRERVTNMQQGGSGTGNNGPGGAPSQNQAGPSDDGFTLTGIVRLANLALAVIRQGDKTFIVGPGDPLEKTSYTLRKIEDDRVTLGSSHKELVLVLRGKKP